MGSTTEVDLERIFHTQLGEPTVDVDNKVEDTGNTTWRVIFRDRGDVPLLKFVSYSALCSVSSEEFLKGNRNQFIIEPKKADGKVLRARNLTAAGFEGADKFLTETFINGEWYADQTTAQVQSAIEGLENVGDGGIDVSMNVITGSLPGTQFLITFLSNLGDVPELVPTNNNIEVSEFQKGITEIQTITVLSDGEFVREEQLFVFDLTSASSNGTVTFTYGSLAPTASVDMTYRHKGTMEADIKDALETLIIPASGKLAVDVSIISYSPSQVAVKVIFNSPVGDAELLEPIVTTGNLLVASKSEVIKGSSPIAGTFTVFFEGQYTNDIAFDASPGDMKDALEAISTIGVVDVDRERLANGYKWTVTFTQNVGNLRMMEATDRRYEIQRLWTEGGAPTPLSGDLKLSFGGDSTTIAYDAPPSELRAALESMPSVGNVEVQSTAKTNGKFEWLITFRSLVGNIVNLDVDYSGLLGSDAKAYVEEIVAGNNDTLTGMRPRLQNYEKVAGRPDYTGQYVVDEPGNYEVKISQLHVGGLSAQYFDNQWLHGLPSMEQIDPTIDFEWGTGFVTKKSIDYASVRWSGKLKVDRDEIYTFYLDADDEARLYVNHTLLIDMGDECCIEKRVRMQLNASVYYDIVVEYKELTGSASVRLSYSSMTLKKQTIPSSKLFYVEPIIGSPFDTAVVPGAAEYPYTDAYGDGLANAISGTPAQFFIQTKDSRGNNLTHNYEFVDPTDLLSVKITSTLNGGEHTVYYADLEYLGNGLFSAAYLPLRAGPYVVDVKMGERDIHCGKSESSKCSPFNLYIKPGPTVPMISEVE